jgi:uncharacterized protein YjbI with pentapeptide repeats
LHELIIMPIILKKVFNLFQEFAIWVKKKAIEPTANWLENAAIFRVFEKLSPIIEAVGVILIPIAIFWFTQSDAQHKEGVEKSRRAQESVKTYLGQLTTVFLDGNIKKQKELQQVVRASTLALFLDPDLDGNRKGQVIRYLSELKLIQGNFADKAKPYISLMGSPLQEANLTGSDLQGADLSGSILFKSFLFNVPLSGVNLSGANLEEANLMAAKILNANLSNTYLQSSNLTGADLSKSNLKNANLSGAVLFGANLSKANFTSTDFAEANLAGANFTEANLSKSKNLKDSQLELAILCKTHLPDSSKLDANRDCGAVKN